MPINNLLIDFDHTLFNTPQIKYEWAATMEECGVPSGVFWQTYPLARYGEGGKPSYNPRKHIELLVKYLNCPLEEALKKIESVVQRSKDFLFPDAKAFLNRMISINVPMILILHGEKEYQEAKVQGAEIIDYFERVYYSDKSRLQIVEELNLDPKYKIFWISHALEDMLRIKKHFPFINPVIRRRFDVSLVRYRGANFLNFSNFEEIQEYLTIVQATSYNN
ncbi:MAG: hypothetical protein HY982_03030 [Candidatus Magasanikbacteria bacterium]|nr:hypothetical protein [Candidatus Magasanikbacteria bacterium]